ncbi:MAG: phosphoribosyl-AMP cyclohydrolase [Pseudomonadota bacterium]|nr:phosphoribosyl-AMP cyclohydrolase [Pseudomonadota bacterium]
MDRALEEGLELKPRYDRQGLVPAIAQEASTGRVLMLAYLNEEALRLTLATGEAHYWSRSRQALWRKGETSGEVQRVLAVHIDCDQDAVLFSVELHKGGLACHTGRKSCFYRRIEAPSGSLRMDPDGRR